MFYAVYDIDAPVLELQQLKSLFRLKEAARGTSPSEKWKINMKIKVIPLVNLPHEFHLNLVKGHPHIHTHSHTHTLDIPDRNYQQSGS